MEEKSKKLLTKAIGPASLSVLIIVLLYFARDYLTYYPLNVESIFYLVMFFVGVNLSKNLPEEGSRYTPLLISIGIALVGVSLYRNVILIDVPLRYNEYEVFFNKFFFLLMVNAVVLSVINLFGYGRDVHRFKISRISQGVMGSQKMIILLTTIYLIYFLYIRGALPYENLDYVDWILVVLFGFLISQNFWMNVKNRVEYEDTLIKGKRHQQSVEQYQYDRINDLKELQRNFIDNGNKEFLLMYLMGLLKDLPRTYSNERIAVTLQPLIYYRDRTVPRYAFKWWKNRVVEENEKNRKRVLKKVIDNIEEDLGDEIREIERRR